MEFSLFLYLALLLLCSWLIIVESYQKDDQLMHKDEYGVKDVKTDYKKGGDFASGSINLGGLELCQISQFTEVWRTDYGGPEDFGVTFFEASSLPDGFSILGSYAQANNKPLFGGWVLAAKDNQNESSNGTLKMPVDYTLVWSSESMNVTNDSNGYIWLPSPPDGYSAVGLVVTNSTNKPPLEKVRCVRSDLLESGEQDEWIWGEGTGQIIVYGLRPTTRGTNALGVQVGTFVVQVAGADTPLPLFCLKNVNFTLAYMPNATQIEALVQAHSPRIYFHPDEDYLPSSVDWLFSKGALLYQKGNESNPISIQPNGLNLPQGGTDDGAYWLDLPIDEGAKDEVKKGDLQSATTYLHIKPMLGATFTDISIWIFYPFNGPATAKVQLINIHFKKLGEHIGDWEHVTLRISNFNGELWRVYFSEHDKGTWVNAAELEFEGTKFVAYSSLHGHAAYPKPGLVLQGDTELGIGLRNDAAKSNILMDTDSNYEIVSAEYLGTIVEPPWLNFSRKWGPKISNNIAKEFGFIHKLFPGVNLTKVFPDGLFGEDGPTGPKWKNNWSGDEVI
ncbi:hypothetical protein IFM89_012283 [Coptis chinensis]|uniref:Vacuolar protein sorting-associated protein 62 n=1 Tax=Coptis chinensis TaxID=261450 RepID=A0A835HE16_9MAGN|nr:hypothetical protein IFM89_012283 [Coptis chinensis]